MKSWINKEDFRGVWSAENRWTWVFSQPPGRALIAVLRLWLQIRVSRKEILIFCLTTFTVLFSITDFLKTVTQCFQTRWIYCKSLYNVLPEITWQISISLCIDCTSPPKLFSVSIQRALLLNFSSVIFRMVCTPTQLSKLGSTFKRSSLSRPQGSHWQ